MRRWLLDRDNDPNYDVDQEGEGGDTTEDLSNQAENDDD